MNIHENKKKEIFDTTNCLGNSLGSVIDMFGEFTEYTLYYIRNNKFPFFQIELLNVDMKNKLIKWNKITEQEYIILRFNFIDNKLEVDSDEEVESDEELESDDEKNFYNHMEKKTDCKKCKQSLEKIISNIRKTNIYKNHLSFKDLKREEMEKLYNKFSTYHKIKIKIKDIKNFFGKEIDITKEKDIIIDLYNFINYRRKMNEIKFKYTGISDIENNIEENEHEYKNTNNTILIYNDNTKMSIVDNDINKYALKLLDNNICGYKKYIEFDEHELKEIQQLLILFDKKCFDSEEDFLNELNMFKKLYKIDDPLKKSIDTFINSNYIITDNIDNRIKASILFNEIYKFLGKEENISLRNKLTNYLLDMGIKKKRYNDGIYYYGLQNK